LDYEGIVALAVKGVDAIHPGLRLLSEIRPASRLRKAAGITLVGPSAELLELVGD